MPFMVDPLPLWDFDDPATSEARFRDAAVETSGDDAEEWLTQVARALGLQERYDAGHAVLDGLTASSPAVGSRAALERGRLLRSSGDVAAARTHFDVAVALAHEAGLEALEVDALHMVALAAPEEDQLARNAEALAVARCATDPAARDWDASLLNNIGMCHAGAGDFGAALTTFEEALAARRRMGDDGRTRTARWMVAWALRHLGRTDEALSVQRGIRAELDRVGEEDPYVDEEIALLESGRGGVP